MKTFRLIMSIILMIISIPLFIAAIPAFVVMLVVNKLNNFGDKQTKHDSHNQTT